MENYSRIVWPVAVLMLLAQGARADVPYGIAAPWMVPIPVARCCPTVHGGGDPIQGASVAVDSIGNWEIAYDDTVLPPLWDTDPGGEIRSYIKIIEEGSPYAQIVAAGHLDFPTNLGDLVHSPSLVIDGNGTTHLAYETTSGDIMYAQKQASSGLWTGATTVAQHREDGISLAVDSVGNWKIAYDDSLGDYGGIDTQIKIIQKDSPYAQIVAAARVDWENGVPKGAAVQCPSLAIDGTGTTHLTYRMSTPHTKQVIYAQKPASGNWAGFVPVAQCTEELLFSTSIAADSAGNWKIAYVTRGNQSGAVMDSCINIVAKDSPYRQTAARAAGAIVSSSLAIDGNGITHLAYGVVNSGSRGYPTSTVMYAQQLKPTHVLCIGVHDRGDLYGGYEHLGNEGAERVCEAFSKLRGVVDATAVPLETGDLGNKQKLVEAINEVKNRLGPSDNFIFYINCHGYYDYDDAQGTYVALPGNEPGVWAMPVWNESIDRTVYTTGNENLLLSRSSPGDNISDDDFSGFFLDPVWEGTNKWFLFDCCYAGGFWGTVGGLDTGDLGRLQRAALLVAAPEADKSKAWPPDHWGVMGHAIEDVLSDLAQSGYMGSITFDEFEQLVNAAAQKYGGFGYPQHLDEAWGTLADIPWNACSFSSNDAAFDLYVPEPATLSLLALGGLGVLLRCRRKDRSPGTRFPGTDISGTREFGQYGECETQNPPSPLRQAQGYGGQAQNAEPSQCGVRNAECGTDVPAPPLLPLGPYGAFRISGLIRHSVLGFRHCPKRPSPLPGRRAASKILAT
jgi:hypothetical protein